ncbi:hypothetical protein FK531_00285 [Rhodococcus spelaei]|uniref:Uncharacterized protein n=1 Tax=Rhodococcus spelaei TaxID=2546320 RepID=A0A541BQJ9_9NOCA|nr:hypothetical protein [Rhodococcus spelaei]TQF74590.1 hypothetical protein FK531_00285 [Rhodococcus spelaei]
MTESTDASELSKWVDMVDWLVDSLGDKPVGFTLNLGPHSLHLVGDEEDDVVCAQLQVLADGVLMLRRSRKPMDQLMFGDYSTDSLVLDHWYFDDHFEDCTDGYLFSHDVPLVADACVTWFRDNRGTRSADELGCEYRFPDEFPDPPPLLPTDRGV